VEKTLEIKTDITLKAVKFGKRLLNLQVITWVSLGLRVFHSFANIRKKN
jgi:hypothetical protein